MPLLASAGAARIGADSSAAAAAALPSSRLRGFRPTRVAADALLPSGLLSLSAAALAALGA